MKDKNSIPIRSDKNFKKMINEIQLERIKKGRDLKFTRSSRITLAMTRHPDFKKIKQDIIEADLK